MKNTEEIGQKLQSINEGILEVDDLQVDWAIKQWEKYLRLVEGLLTEDDLYYSKGEHRKKKTAWRKLAMAFRISIKIVEKNIIRDEQGRTIAAEFFVKASTPKGVETTAFGECSLWEEAHENPKTFGSYENQWTCPAGCDGRKHFNNPDHTIVATALTRAKNIAISDIIGVGEISAEELSILKNKGKQNPPNKLKKKGQISKNPKVFYETPIEALKAITRDLEEKNIPKTKERIVGAARREYRQTHMSLETYKTICEEYGMEVKK